MDTVSVVGPTEVYLFDFFYSGMQLYALLSPYLCFISFLNLDLYLLGDDTLRCIIDKIGILHANQTSICLNTHQK